MVTCVVSLLYNLHPVKYSLGSIQLIIYYTYIHILFINFPTAFGDKGRAAPTCPLYIDIYVYIYIYEHSMDVL